MKYLLDTCTLLWFADGSSKIPAQSLQIIQDPHKLVAASVISFWELSMKVVTGKLPSSLNPNDLNVLAINQAIDILPLTIAQVEQFHHLPVTHPDPFDRLLAAVAIDGRYTILSPDIAFDTLGVNRVW